MRIAVFSEMFWPEGGGSELATYLILKLLSSSGDFELEVYTGTQTPARMPRVVIRTVDFFKATNKVQLYLNILKSKNYIQKIIERVDTVYIPKYGYPIIPIAKKLGKRVIVHLHDYQPVSYTSVILSSEVSEPMTDFKRTLILESVSSGLIRAISSSMATPLTRLIRMWVSMSDKIVCVSHRHKEILLRLAPEYREKAIVVYNPPPEVPEVVKSLSEKPTLLYAGGDSYVKGFYVLLQALRTLGRKRQANFKLVLINKYRQESLRMIEYLKNKYDLDIQVVGRVDYEKLIKFHSRSWGLLFPSICEETFGYAVLESMLLGTIPIATRIGAIPEIVSGTPGELFLFEFGDSESLVSKILELMSLSKEEALSMGRVLREKALINFNRESIKKLLLKVIGGLN